MQRYNNNMQIEKKKYSFSRNAGQRKQILQRLKGLFLPLKFCR